MHMMRADPFVANFNSLCTASRAADAFCTQGVININSNTQGVVKKYSDTQEVGSIYSDTQGVVTKYNS